MQVCPKHSYLLRVKDGRAVRRHSGGIGKINAKVKVVAEIGAANSSRIVGDYQPDYRAISTRRIPDLKFPHLAQTTISVIIYAGY